MSELYIGLMSGTSVDGIDAALVDFSEFAPKMVAKHYTAYSSSLREKILSLCQKGDDEIARFGELDVQLGKEFAIAVNSLLKQEALLPSDIKAIGSHGQTVRHLPLSPHRFTIQIGDPNTIVAHTGITTVADFRRKDMAVGGQGAPLVPAFHHYLFASQKNNRAIINIGGIANVTILSTLHPIIGFDTGPGNMLMDAWIGTHQHESHDRNGEWAAGGKIDETLLQQFLADPYFHLPSPKSTGREYFHLNWLQKNIENKKISAVDVQATLVELTAKSIVSAVQSYFSHGEMIICGGGTHNALLMKRIEILAGPLFTVASTQKYGIDPDWVEAMAFAWLARQTLHRQTGNLPSVTGAKERVVLGGIYY